MATSRYQGHCRTSTLEDDDHDDVVIMPKTTSVTPLAGNVPSTPPRISRVLGLVTPPDSQSKPNSDIRSTSPPSTPIRRPDVPKDTKPLTVSENPSEWFSDQSTIIPFPPLAGLLTPDNTPPRRSKPRPVPVAHKEETIDKSESSLSLEITSTVVGVSDTSEHHSEVIQNTAKSEPVMRQCNDITNKTKCQCIESVQDPDCYCIHHINQDTGPSNPSANVRDPQHRQSQDTAIKPTTDANSQCHGFALCGIQRHLPRTVPIPPQLATEVNPQYHGPTLHGIQCRLPVKSPVQYNYQDEYQSNDTSITPIVPPLIIEVNSRCHGLTLHGIQCARSVKPPAKYCYQHESQSTYTPSIPIAPKLTTNVTWQCHGLTLRGIQCRRSIKPPAQYCYQHKSQSTYTPTMPITPKLTNVTWQCHGLTLRGIQCGRSVKPPAQYCYHHVSQSTNIPTIPIAPKPMTIISKLTHFLAELFSNIKTCF
jgi:hypothetical protein